MARILVLPDQDHSAQEDALLDEIVSSVHLATEHSADQFVERVVWAINDAEHNEQLALSP